MTSIELSHLKGDYWEAFNITPGHHVLPTLSVTGTYVEYNFKVI